MRTKNKLRQIYKLLLKSYGPQGWWPVTRDIKKGPEYFPGRYEHPRNENEAWEIMVGAILTQNTAWKNVEKAIMNLLKADCLNIECLAKIEKNTLAELIRPAGYYNQKAERLQNLARYVLENWEDLGAFFNRPTLEIREELLSLSGIGKETADSILLYAGKKPIFVVDAYTKRIFYRLGLIHREDLEYDEIRGMVEDAFSEEPEETRRKIFNEFHALLVEHAKRYCRKRPKCEGCPLRGQCSYIHV